MFGQKLKHLDIYGKPIEFKFTKEVKKFKTKCGALFTLIFICAFIMGFTIFYRSYKQTKDPRVTISMQKTQDYPKIDLLENDFFPLISIANQTSLLSASEMPKYATVVMYNVAFDINPSDPLKSKGVFKGPIRFVDCRKSKIDSNFILNYIKESNTEILYNLGLFLCPEQKSDKENWIISGSGNNLPFAFQRIFFFPCSLEDASECAPTSKLAILEVRISTSSRTYDISNKEDPIEIIYVGDRLKFGFHPGSTQQYDLDFKKIRMINEDADFSGPRLQTEFFSFDETTYVLKLREGPTHCTPEQLASLLCSPYTVVELKSGSRVESVLRVYPKFFSMLSRVGGFGNMVFVVTGILYFFFRKKNYQKWVKDLILSQNEKNSCFDILKKNQEMLTKEKFEEIADQFYEEKLSAIELVKNSNLTNAIRTTLMSPDYAAVLSLFPLLNKIDQEGRENGEKGGEKSLRESIEAVLRSNPTNQFENMIKKHLENILDSDSRVSIKGVSCLDDSSMNLRNGDNLDSDLINSSFSGPWNISIVGKQNKVKTTDTFMRKRRVNNDLIRD